MAPRHTLTTCGLVGALAATTTARSVVHVDRVTDDAPTYAGTLSNPPPPQRDKFANHAPQLSSHYRMLHTPPPACVGVVGYVGYVRLPSGFIAIILIIVIVIVIVILIIIIWGGGGRSFLAICQRCPVRHLGHWQFGQRQMDLRPQCRWHPMVA